jgi:hypothetical protein
MVARVYYTSVSFLAASCLHPARRLWINGRFMPVASGTLQLHA